MKPRGDRFCLFAGCHNRLFRTWPYCHDHIESQYGVVVQKSRISQAGYGVFAVRDFAAGEKILEYTGDRLSKQELDQRYGDSLGVYVLQVTKDIYIDASSVRSGVARFVNDARGQERNRIADFWFIREEPG